jgi:thiamine pyrophosphokinase
MPSPGAVLVANGPIRWTRELASLAATAKPLLAADGGANALGRIGLRPAAVIGDLDSITPGIRAFVGEDRLLERPDQDRTDLDKALEHAFSDLGLDRLTVLGATGGRLDHAVANLGLLAARAMADRLVFLAADHRVVAVTGEVVLEAVVGETWSFFAFDPAARVRLGGVRWPLIDRPVTLVGMPSISNEAVADRVVIRAEGGAVMAVRWFVGAP